MIWQRKECFHHGHDLEYINSVIKHVLKAFLKIFIERFITNQALC